MKNRAFASFLLLTIAFHLVTTGSIIRSEQCNDNDNLSISLLIEADELLPPNLKSMTNVIDRKVVQKYYYNDDSISFQKGNSNFYFCNQNLPKTLAISKRNSTFFSVYFSTAV